MEGCAEWQGAGLENQWAFRPCRFESCPLRSERREQGGTGENLKSPRVGKIGASKASDVRNRRFLKQGVGVIW